MKKIDRAITLIDDEKNIKQSNRLIEARYKLSLVESKIVNTIGSQLAKSGEKFEMVRVSATALIDFCGFPQKHGYSWLKAACRNLRQRVIEINYPDGSWYVTGWVNSAHYHDGVIDFQLDERLKEDLLNVNKAYLAASPKMLCSFHRVFSPRLYMLLKKCLKMGEIEYDIDFIIDRFVLPKSYKVKFIHFRKKFIEPCLKEINEKSDIKVNHEFVKEGRAYKTIRFTITAKEEKQEQNEKVTSVPSGDPLPDWAKDYTDEQKAVLIRLQAFPVSAAREVVENHTPEDITALIDYVCKKYAPENQAGQIVSLARKNFIESRRAREKRKAASAASEEKPQTDNKTEKAEDAAPMNQFQAKYLRDAEKRGEIDKVFNILTAEDEVRMPVKAGLRSVKQYGYTWQDIIDFSNGDREE